MRLDLDADDGTCQKVFRKSLIASAGVLRTAMPVDLYAAVSEAAESDDPVILRAVAGQLRAWDEMPPRLGHAGADESGAAELERFAVRGEDVPMGGSGQQATDSTADEMREYKRAIETHQDHAVIKRWFYQITPCKFVVPGSGTASFLMIEFRDGRLGAMVWNDGNGNWGTGGWRLLSRKGVLAINIAYMQGAAAASTFTDVLDMVAARRLEVQELPPQPRPWWRFWN
jgi:hypothetical protein